MITWIVIVEWLARLILALLIGLSVWSISIMIERRRFFKDFIKTGNAHDELSQRMSKYKNAQSIERAAGHYMSELRPKLEKGLPVLGTLGSTAPFIGLFGTVLGIIVSFGELSKNVSDMNGVMFSLAEALVLTAAGLAVAIPAVIAFNVFSRSVKSILRQCEAKRDLHIASVTEGK